jgi:phage-related protein
MTCTTPSRYCAHREAADPKHGTCGCPGTKASQRKTRRLPRPTRERALSITTGRADRDSERSSDAPVGVDASELRVKTQDGAYRTFYYTATERGVVVFHALIWWSAIRPQRAATDGC